MEKLNLKKISSTYLTVFILIVIALSGLVGANYLFAKNNPGGNDFIPRWLGTRLFLTERQNPYSDETTASIQDFIYGRAAEEGEDQQLFVYPYYSMLVFSPFASIEEYALARGLWMTVLEISLIAISVISLKLLNWRPSVFQFGLFFFFTLTWYHGVRPIINGNASVLVALFIAGVLLLIRFGFDQYAGILLALTSIKPQMVVLFIPLTILWGLSNRRWALARSSGVAFFILLIGSIILQPNWILLNIRQIATYPSYTEPGSPGSIFQVWWPSIGDNLGWAFTILLGFLLVREWILVLGKDFRHFLWAACLTLIITNLIGIRSATANYIALVPALVLIFVEWERRWEKIGGWLVVFTLISIFVGLWWLFLATLHSGPQPIQDPIMFFPFTIFLLIGLYWVRWWYLQGTTLDKDNLLLTKSES